MAKTIIITGAGAGLGRTLAQRFAQDGETVILLGRTLSKLQALADELGPMAWPVECDIASPDSVRAAFAVIAASHPKIDVLINNAAIYQPFMIAEASDEDILSPLLTNFAGPIFCARAVIPMMQRGGHIINISSESVLSTITRCCRSTRAPRPGWSASPHHSRASLRQTEFAYRPSALAR